MPISIGSVGDIVALGLLVKDIIQALSECNGSSTEFKETIRQLDALDRTLPEVTLLLCSYEHTTELALLCETARRNIENLQQLIDAFRGRIAKYRSSLGASTTGYVGLHKKSLGQAARKIQWRVEGKHGLEKFRAEVGLNSTSLHTILATANIMLQSLNSKKSQDALQQLKQDTSCALRNNDQALKEILKQAEDTNRFLQARVANVGEIQLQDCATLAKELADLRYLLRERTAAPSRPFYEDVFFLEDPIGRTNPLCLRSINCWDALDDYIELAFRRERGLNKVRKKEYILQDRYTKKDIYRNARWDVTFVAGLRVDMSMLYKSFMGNLELEELRRCPRCSYLSHETSAALTQCEECGMCFEIVIDEDDTNDYPEQNLLQADTSTETDDDVKMFSRVRLQLIQKKTTNQDEEGTEIVAISVTAIEERAETNAQPCLTSDTICAPHKDPTTIQSDTHTSGILDLEHILLDDMIYKFVWECCRCKSSSHPIRAQSCSRCNAKRCACCQIDRVLK